MAVGNKIKRYRELRNFTQAYMAEELNISQNAYSKIETGNVKLTVERLQKIAELLDVPAEDIISFKDEQHFNFTNSTVDKFYGYIENVHEHNKAL